MFTLFMTQPTEESSNQIDKILHEQTRNTTITLLSVKQAQTHRTANKPLHFSSYISNKQQYKKRDQGFNREKKNNDG